VNRDRDLLIEKIRSSFESSILFNGMTLRKCAALDNRIDEDDPELAEISQCYKWQEIPEDEMHLFGTHGVLNHSGEINVQFYLPPAMIYVLKHKLMGSEINGVRVH